MKIVIPMAGEGSRFVKAGYKLPKPLIDVEGKPMIQRVVENLPFDAEFVFLVRLEHLKNYMLESVLYSSTNGRCKIVPVEYLTEGAACTVLLAEDLINNDEAIMISNCDELIDYSVEDFNKIRKANPSSDFIWVFKDTSRNPKWSFAQTRIATNTVMRVAEKQPISSWATCGVYHWSHGKDFVSCARTVIEKNKRVNGEFYVCPVYEERLMMKDAFVCIFPVNKMWGLGTPEDLDAYLHRPQR